MFQEAGRDNFYPCLLFFFQSLEGLASPLTEEAALPESLFRAGWLSATLIKEDTLPPPRPLVCELDFACLGLRLLTPLRPIIYSFEIIFIAIFPWMNQEGLV
jgi:hypothetical protein